MKTISSTQLDEISGYDKIDWFDEDTVTIALMVDEGYSYEEARKVYISAEVTGSKNLDYFHESCTGTYKDSQFNYCEERLQRIINDYSVVEHDNYLYPLNIYSQDRYLNENDYCWHWRERDIYIKCNFGKITSEEGLCFVIKRKFGNRYSDEEIQSLYPFLDDGYLNIPKEHEHLLSGCRTHRDYTNILHIVLFSICDVLINDAECSEIEVNGLEISHYQSDSLSDIKPYLDFIFNKTTE
jgi:hypothetical protein